jgi:hypothetical protein
VPSRISRRIATGLPALPQRKKGLNTSYNMSRKLVLLAAACLLAAAVFAHGVAAADSSVQPVQRQGSQYNSGQVGSSPEVSQQPSSSGYSSQSSMGNQYGQYESSTSDYDSQLTQDVSTTNVYNNNGGQLTVDVTDIYSYNSTYDYSKEFNTNYSCPYGCKLHNDYKMDKKGSAYKILDAMNTIGGMLVKKEDCPYSTKMCSSIYKSAYSWGEAAALRTVYLARSTKRAVEAAVAWSLTPINNDLECIKNTLIKKHLQLQQEEADMLLDEVIKLIQSN